MKKARAKREDHTSSHAGAAPLPSLHFPHPSPPPFSRVPPVFLPSDDTPALCGRAIRRPRLYHSASDVERAPRGYVQRPRVGSNRDRPVWYSIRTNGISKPRVRTVVVDRRIVRIMKTPAVFPVSSPPPPRVPKVVLTERAFCDGATQRRKAIASTASTSRSPRSRALATYS